MAKDPAVLFYTSDFMMGTSTMTNEQVGMYIRLLCIQHQSKFISEEDMNFICPTHDKKVLSKFIKNLDGTYYNDRMKIEAEKRKEYCLSRSKNKKNTSFQSSYVEHMNNISISHVQHMENENENNKIIVSKIPKIEEVIKFFKDRGYIEKSAEQFFYHWEEFEWKNKKGIINWKEQAAGWFKDEYKIENQKKVLPDNIYPGSIFSGTMNKDGSINP